jgi:hypothetical protein
MKIIWRITFIPQFILKDSDITAVERNLEKYFVGPI